MELPKNTDIEASVLGTMIMYNNSVHEAMPLLKNYRIFSDVGHQFIFKAIANLYEANNSIDVLTVSNELKKLNALESAGGDYKIIELTQGVITDVRIEYHCRILQELFIRRELINKCNQIRVKAYGSDNDVFDLLHDDAKGNDDLSEIIVSGNEMKTYASALDDVVKRVELLSNQKEGEFTGVPTGFKKIDSFTGGWQPSNLIILAARPGMGKTALMLKNAVACAKAGVACGVFSLEMSIQELTARTISINSHFPLQMLIRDGFKKDSYFSTLLSKKDEMSTYPIYVDDTGGLDIRDIISRARVWKRKYDIKILFVDYIQLIKDRSKGNNREQEVASISRNLKLIAKELDIPVMALSQLSRAVETRMDKRPKLSDLRESGSIEQDADIVTFLYREGYYNPDGELPDDMLSQGANAEFSFAKYRSGSLETKGLYWDANKAKFCDPEEFNNNWDESELPKPSSAKEVPF